MSDALGSPEVLGASRAKLILQQLERILRADYSGTLPTGWEGIEGAIAKITDDIAASRELFHLSLLSTIQSMGQVDAFETLIDPETLPGRMGDVVKGLNEMRHNLITTLSGLEVIARREGLGGLPDLPATTSDGNFGDVHDNLNSMLFIMREGVLGRAMTSQLTATIANLNQNMQYGRGVTAVTDSILREMAELIGVVQGRFYLRRPDEGELQFALTSSYSDSGLVVQGEIGDTCDLLIEEMAGKGELFVIANPPLARYQTLSSFGDPQPWSVAVLPIIFNNQVQAILEFAAKRRFSASALEFLRHSNVIVGLAINNANLHLQSEQERQKLRKINHELEFRTLEMRLQRNRLEITKSQLEKKTAELELNSKYKSQFFSKMSHELRTPITSLLILTELLKDNPKGHLDAGELEFAKMIYASSKDLISLIDDILDISKIEAGVISLNVLPVSLAEIIHRSESTFRPVALNRGIDFNILLGSNLPTLLVTDELRFRQIINNLLSNAVKFTERGVVSLSVELVHSGWSRNNIQLNKTTSALAFTVKDSGIGIDSTSFANIFEVYNRGDDHVSRNFGGTGLGLPISRQIADMLGGELILIESAPGQGSTFTLFLPLEDKLTPSKQVREPSAIENPKGQRRSPTSRKKFVGRKVLVVDDDANTASSLSAALTSLGLISYSQNNGLSAIEFLEETKDIDLVFMDCAMPEMNGVETITRIGKSAKIKKLPIIVLTAQATERNLMDCLAAGACDYESKPITKEKLSFLVQRWLP